MADQTDTEDVKHVESFGQDQQEQEPRGFDRNHPAFLAVTKQLNELKAERDALREAERKAAEEAERKKLEEKGEYESLVAKIKADAEAQKAQYERRILEFNIRTELLKAGAQNDLFVQGVIASYQGDPDGIGEYIEQLKTDAGNAPFFGIAQTHNGITPPGPANPATRGVNNWRQVQADLRSSDLAKVQAATKAVNDYVVQNNGTLPPGFD